MTCIYKSMVLPFFDYGDVIIAGAGPRLLGKLQKLQNRCLKICLGIVDGCSPDILHNRVREAKLGDRRKMHVNNFMFKRKEKNVGLAVHDENLTQTRIRAAPNFNLVKLSNDMYRRSVCYYGAQQWNQLPGGLRRLDSFVSFKSRCKYDLKRKIY